MSVTKLVKNLTIVVATPPGVTSVKDTVKSVLDQSIPPQNVVVIDTGKIEDLKEIVEKCPVTTIKLPENVADKEAAQNIALRQIDSKYVMVLDADKVLAPDALEAVMKAFADKKTVVACGAIVPKSKISIWDRAKYIEYLFAFSLDRPFKKFIRRPLISSECFYVYRTPFLKGLNGWSSQAASKDADLVWKLFQTGVGVKFIPKAKCHTIVSRNFDEMSTQTKLWSKGYIQNIKENWDKVIAFPKTNPAFSIGTVGLVVTAFIYLLLFPTLAVYFRNPIFLLGYVIDLPAFILPVLIKGILEGEFLLVLTGLPSYVVLRILNSLFIFEAFWNEIILNKKIEYSKASYTPAA